MRFSAIVSFAVTAILFMATPNSACKCLVHGHTNTTKTINCCGSINGTTHGNDCSASSIGKHFSSFKKGAVAGRIAAPPTRNRDRRKRWSKEEEERKKKEKEKRGSRTMSRRRHFELR